jgi:hypothetical protein
VLLFGPPTVMGSIAGSYINMVIPSWYVTPSHCPHTHLLFYCLLLIAWHPLIVLPVSTHNEWLQAAAAAVSACLVGQVGVEPSCPARQSLYTLCGTVSKRMFHTVITCCR